MTLMKLYNSYYNEYRIATQAFYTWKAINNKASKDHNTYCSINENATTWNIILYSLQSTYFISLRRLFDRDLKTLSVDGLLKACIDNIYEFSKEKIAERKIGNSGKKPEWLDKYLEGVFQIDKKDLQKLRGQLSKYNKLYEKKFQPICNKIFAHRELKYIEKFSMLFKDVKIKDAESILDFLFQIDRILFDLLHNGRYEGIGFYKCKEEEYINKDVEQLLQKVSNESTQI